MRRASTLAAAPLALLLVAFVIWPIASVLVASFRLEGPLPYATLRRTQVPDDTLVVNVGRVLDGVPSRKELYRSAAIRVRDGKTINFSHDYVSVDKIQPGDSGGPTYRDGSKPPELVAVNSGAGDGFAVLARIDIVMSWITERVNQNGGFALPPGYQALTPQKPGLVDRNP